LTPQKMYPGPWTYPIPVPIVYLCIPTLYLYLWYTYVYLPYTCTYTCTYPIPTVYLYLYLRYTYTCTYGIPIPTLYLYLHTCTQFFKGSLYTSPLIFLLKLMLSCLYIGMHSKQCVQKLLTSFRRRTAQFVDVFVAPWGRSH
jgi:hypothetical protein